MRSGSWKDCALFMAPGDALRGGWDLDVECEEGVGESMLGWAARRLLERPLRLLPTCPIDGAGAR